VGSEDLESNLFRHPLVERYASRKMLHIFSPTFKFQTWRRLWIALAETQKELGLPITEHQINQMKKAAGTIDLKRAREIEEEVRHDVMAHILLFGEAAPDARPVIHLGATSAFVTDNTEVIQMKEALKLILSRLVNVADRLGNFAAKYADTPTLGFTHFQPAQFTTVGKRATLWINDLLLDIEEIDFVLAHLRFRGVKGATGTQASFLCLFDGDAEKVRKLDVLLANRMGFTEAFAVTGQTYTRKQDARVLYALSSVAQSAHKFANDLRLLSHLREVEEPYSEKQVGSSAMAHKRNPMRCERMTALARYLIVNSLNAALTAAEQWFERTLDDSANRRISIPEGFLCADAVLRLYLNIVSGLSVNEVMVEKHLLEESSFLAAEGILMEAVKAGGDRQTLHERLRVYCREAAGRVKEGKPNNFLSLIAADPLFSQVKLRLAELSNPAKLVGLAPDQTRRFLAEKLQPLRRKYQDLLSPEDEAVSI